MLKKIKEGEDFEELAKGDVILDSEKLTDELFTDLDKNIKRKNILLDHLIARFAEKFSDYAFLMKELYGSYAEQAVVDAKTKFLSEYGEIIDKNILTEKYLLKF